MEYYDSEFGQNYQIPFDYSYQIAPSEFISAFSTAHSNTIVNDHQCFLYDPMSYYHSPSNQTTFASVAYSASALSEPKHVVYDPNSYSIYESPPDALSQFRISYSVSEFNETDFEEYDPTPYGGGYDICATYGKPLPPSEKTCYPRSSVDPTDSPSLKKVPLGSVVELSNGKEKVNDHGSVPEPADETKMAPAAVEEKGQQKEEEEKEDGDDKEEQEDHRSSCGSEKSGNGDEEKVRARYVPSGYGLEAMDLCEAIFGGYFPCLLRNRRWDDRNSQEVSCWERNESDPWERTSDYLFGNLYPYGDGNYDGRSYTGSFYGYQRQYQEQPMYQIQMVDYEEEQHSW